MMCLFLWCRGKKYSILWTILSTFVNVYNCNNFILKTINIVFNYIITKCKTFKMVLNNSNLTRPSLLHMNSFHGLVKQRFRNFYTDYMTMLSTMSSVVTHIRKSISGKQYTHNRLQKRSHQNVKAWRHDLTRRLCW